MPVRREQDGHGTWWVVALAATSLTLAAAALVIAAGEIGRGR